MTLRIESTVTCDAPDCTASVVGKLPRTDAHAIGWVTGSMWRPRGQPLAIDYCPLHADLMPKES